MTAERRPVQRDTPDRLVLTLARIAQRIAEREAAERLERRATMTVVQGGKAK